MTCSQHNLNIWISKKSHTSARKSREILTFVAHNKNPRRNIVMKPYNEKSLGVKLFMKIKSQFEKVRKELSRLATNITGNDSKNQIAVCGQKIPACEQPYRNTAPRIRTEKS